MHRFKSVSLSHIPRKENSNADALVRLATGGPGKGRKKARIEVLGSSSLSKTISEIFMVEAGPGEPTWMDPIVEFMKEGVRPEDRGQARKLQSRCARYTLMNGKLYCKGYSFPNLKCVMEEEGEAIMGGNTRGLVRESFWIPTNGQVDEVNKIIKKLLKKKLDDAKSLWAQKLPEVLWVIRTTTTEATGETPFSMAFGTEAVLPIETSIPSGRVENFDATTNEEGLRLNIDLIEERKEKADLHNQVYKQRVARHYNSKVRTQTLGQEDWVMKKIMTKTTTLDPT
uniref:uncharacterized protein LOC105349506 n=1 Tax=Fragaria vesca subsp. vesca TaxID=101020 RepID=UPI0005CA40F5|nr:PREDICTED: uncharacterized protein LOC105349506 [Fragaria vesca subsp. vesca]